MPVDRLVIITGQMRSGTSLVAEVCHVLGCPVAITMHAPIPPHYRCDWEDQEIAEWLMNRELLGCPTGRLQDFRPILRQRLHDMMKLDQVYEAFGRHKMNRKQAEPTPIYELSAIGLKQPLLSLYLPQIQEVASDMGLKLVIIQTERAQEAIDRSIRSAFAPSMVDWAFAVNEKIRAVAVTPDLTIGYEKAVGDPHMASHLIARAIGASVAGERFREASIRVRPPRQLPA